MVKEILGWNDPGCFGFQQEVEFFRAPLWLRILARTFYFERFAYPHAARKGLIIRWANTPTLDSPDERIESGIKYMNKRIPEVSPDDFFEFDIDKITEFALGNSKIEKKFIQNPKFSLIGLFLKSGAINPFATRLGMTLKYSQYERQKWQDHRSS